MEVFAKGSPTTKVAVACDVSTSVDRIVFMPKDHRFDATGNAQKARSFCLFKIYSPLRSAIVDLDGRARGQSRGANIVRGVFG